MGQTTDGGQAGQIRASDAERDATVERNRQARIDAKRARHDERHEWRDERRRQRRDY